MGPLSSVDPRSPRRSASSKLLWTSATRSSSAVAWSSLSSRLKAFLLVPPLWRTTTLTAKKVLEVASSKGCKIILPSDVVLADKFAPDAETKVTSASEIPDGWMGLDNGPEATKEIQTELSECKTIIWNGPMGVFEFDAFAKGTFDVADTLAELTGKGACTIIGGGDSVAAVEKAGLAEKMSHVSTGGGASLELLEGKILPGVAALDEL